MDRSVSVTIAVCSILVAVIVAVTGWQIGNSVTNEVSAIRSGVNRDLKAIREDVGGLRGSMDNLTRAVIINTERGNSRDDRIRRLEDIERTGP